jgi:hypothetical protein
MQVVRNSVYVIPPNRDIAILHGKLQLHLPEEPRGQRMPIDIFMRTLAEDQGEHAIGIVLSGTGSDGSLGLRAILGVGGISLVQALEIANDLDDDEIATARAGLYLPSIVQDVTPGRLREFFVREEAGYRIKKVIREMVVFAVQNVIKDPPFTKLDLLSCRNLMIYLEPALQNRLIPSFHYALKTGGVLLL